jgi:hypothetical protein
METPEVQEETTAVEEQPQTPYEFLSSFKSAPTEARLDDIKSSVPGGRIKLFTSSDGKRAYILRGISAFELQKLQDGMLTTVKPDNYLAALKLELASKCCVWTSTTQTGLISNIELKQAGAGLTDTLHEIISELSDYMDAPQIRQFSVDL